MTRSLTTAIYVPLIILCGCGSSVHSVEAMKDLKAVGLAYHNFHNKHDRGPKDVEEFKDYLVMDYVVSTSREAPYLKIKSGDLIFLWNISSFDKNAPTSDHVLAYEKEAPERGGWVLFMDGSTKHLTADEFKAAPRAKE